MSFKLALTLPSMPEIRLPVHWRDIQFVNHEPIKIPLQTQDASSSRSLCFGSFLSLCNIFQHSTDLRWSKVNLRPQKDQCILKSSIAPQCSHPCISCEDAAQPAQRTLSHIGSHFLCLTLAPHLSCSLIGQLPILWPLIGCNHAPADLWVMQSFLSPNTINSSRTAPFRCMGDQGCFQAKFLFSFFLQIIDLKMPWLWVPSQS